MQHPPPPGVCWTGAFFSSAGFICGSLAFSIGSGDKIGAFRSFSFGFGFVPGAPGTGEVVGAPGTGEVVGAPGTGEVSGLFGANEVGEKGLVSPSPDFGSGLADGPEFG